ncbi:MAG: helix-turn-helix domain-containing protein [Nitriliruptor sp.]|uniref:helix-turn-helix domain-containing protein n=1 Tax=Nitriliruptor sp. TaxID=2448056 RepID=UPI0034A07409
MIPDAQQQLGARLRSVRVQQGLSLADVEQRSDGRWKAVVIGAYERGHRAVTIERLAALATFYDVPITHLLPAPASEEPGGARPAGLLLDLTRLADHGGSTEPVGAVARFARRVQLQRGDHAGRVLSLRDADVRTIALSAGVEPDTLHDQLRGHGLLSATA